ncbi:MAG: transposase [Rhodocyclaceae bacterium]|nr:transposase [Rhodocyclaceae bacterium]
MRQWLTANPEERKGAKGKVVMSNRTDNESAKMATSKGVIQGYVGVAAVDDRHQIIVEAQAHGSGSEQSLLLPVVEAATALCAPDTLITADAGYHSEANLKALAERDRPALIADNRMRKRMSASGTRQSTRPSPIRSTTRRTRRRPPATTGQRISTTTRTPAPASARRASRSTRMARTAITTGTLP